MIKYEYTLKTSDGMVLYKTLGEVSDKGSIDIIIPGVLVGGVIEIEWEVEDGNDSNSELESDKTRRG